MTNFNHEIYYITLFHDDLSYDDLHIFSFPCRETSYVCIFGICSFSKYKTNKSEKKKIEMYFLTSNNTMICQMFALKLMKLT